jgi:hypothetical protein
VSFVPFVVLYLKQRATFSAKKWRMPMKDFDGQIKDNERH